jgi:hypothetical protein
LYVIIYKIIPGDGNMARWIFTEKRKAALSKARNYHERFVKLGKEAYEKKVRK